MTIITKPLSEKKSEKLAPLVEHDQLATAPREDVEAQQSPDSAARFVILRARARRVSTTTTLCLLLAAFIVVGIGIIGGTYLYRQYLRAQMHRFWCNIPLNEDDPEQAMAYRSDDNMDNFFQEQFDLDTENEEYEKIDVPDFRDGRSGRFIHDFNTNTTGIIDVTGKRCFVMPLNRGNVLPPRSLFDLLHKMFDGYYKVDTEVVRETMRVVTPPLIDMKGIGSYIAKECEGLPVYKLEKYVGGVVKRSADLGSEVKFAQFSGKGIMEYNIINLEELAAYEEHAKQ